MLRLILFRHAKSSWDNPALSDHARPLNPRGRRAAPRMGDWLREQGFVPDLVLLSDSARTRETWALAAPRLETDAEVVEDAGLYHASPAAMLRRINAAPGGVQSLCVVGHMPGIGSLSRKLSCPRTPPSCARAFTHFPTAAVAVLEFDVATWDDVAYAKGRFHTFVCPKELD